MSRAHIFDSDKGGYLCPITKKYVKSTFTDHRFKDNFNSCIECNPENYIPISERLKRLNEERKRQKNTRRTLGRIAYLRSLAKE